MTTLYMFSVAGVIVSALGVMFSPRPTVWLAALATCGGVAISVAIKSGV